MSIDLHSMVAPYALDALDAHERAQFEAHLAQCSDCQSELAGFEATAARLADAVSLAPPAGLRERLMAAATQTPQERPVTVLRPRQRMRRALPRVAVAAAVLIGAVGVGGYVVERQNAQDAHRENVAMSKVLSAEDLTTLAKTFDGGGSVKLYASASADTALVIAKNLQSPGEGKVYQVWMIDGDGPHSQGYFKHSGQMLMKGVSNAQTIAVTIEPDGGSAQPTSDPVATIPI